MIVKLKFKIISKCPITKERDFCNGEITYKPINQEYIEIFEFKDFIKRFEKEYLFTEDLFISILNKYKDYNISLRISDDSEGVQLEVKNEVL